MFGDLIEYVCIRAGHLPRLIRSGLEITIQSSSWAYCSGGIEGAHESHRVPMGDHASPGSPAVRRVRGRRSSIGAHQ